MGKGENAGYQHFFFFLFSQHGFVTWLYQIHIDLGLRSELLWLLFQGLCKYVISTVPEASTMGVCVGYDGRYNSERFV